MTVADNLRHLRQLAKLSQVRLAERANVSQQLVSQIERGENVSTKYLPQIAKALNCHPGDIDPSYLDAASPENDPVRQELAALLDKLDDAERRLLLGAARGLLDRPHGED
jgi:transcriptional regulator with XRE-family HTH domain